MNSSHALNRRSRLSVAAVALTAVTLLSGCLRADQFDAYKALNADRNARRIFSLPFQDDAQAKAQAWANRLAWEKRLYHSNPPDGIGVRWCSIGENVGYGGSTASVQRAYMNSSGHRTNILDTKWNGVGVGVAYRDGLTFVVQVFIKTC